MTIDHLYEKERKDELREATEEHITLRLVEFINEICKELGWDPLLDYNREEVKDIIKKVL